MLFLIASRRPGRHLPGTEATRCHAHRLEPRALVDAPLILGLGGDLDYNIPAAADDDDPPSGPALYQPLSPAAPALSADADVAVVNLSQPEGNPADERYDATAGIG